MFDLIAGTGVATQRRTILPTIVSMTAHGAVVAAIVIPALFAVGELPEIPTMMAFVAPLDAPPPPPPPALPPAKAMQSQPAALTRPDAAPIETPTTIEPESGFETIEAGVPGGVEGGIPGGVPGGVIGGISEAPPPPPPPPPPARPSPVRVGGQLEAPAVLRRVEPEYPQIAARAQIQGLVILEAMVGEDGTVREVKVLRSVKFLDEAAIDAVKQWRYAPLLLNGEAMPFVLTVSLVFRVDTTVTR